MMSDIKEKIQENISNEVSRKQLIEVVDNYERGYYRSAIVVLYTTILYEILKQLENLRDFYNNKSAEEIIEKIENQKNNNPKSPSWEGMLIDELKSRNFITSNDYKDLEEIQRFRNYGAHPIIEVETGKIEILLRDVQEEEVKLALVNSLRIVFFNHLGLGSKYAKEIVDYAKDYISNNGYGKEFDNQFIDVYLSRTNKATYKNIFKILYKEAFVADGAIDDKQREYLINILRVVYNFNPEYCCEAITDNSYNLLSVLPD
ncbi:TPA: hypothetical protein ACGO7G_001978, partial [Streptococcus suis]